MPGISISFPMNFPRDSLNRIGRQLEESGCVIPGFQPPVIGLLHTDALAYGQMAEGLNYTLFVDRNLASRVAKVARERRVSTRDVPTNTAIDLMAFAQFTDLMIEPSIAFHELASTQGNKVAHEELSWFRAADRSNPDDWLNLSLGVANEIDVGPPKTVGTENLEFPLRRWQRNYIICLKIAEIELSMQSNCALKRLTALLRWMEDEFFVAGPAAAYAALYFAPSGGRRGLFKSLRSLDRERARQGVMTAAWDATHISDFVRRVNYPDAETDRFMFATADKKLADIAHKLLLSHDLEIFQSGLRDWWGEVLADEVVELLRQVIERALGTPEHKRPAFTNEEIEMMILDGEQTLRQADL